MDGRERPALGFWRLAADGAIFVFGVGIPLWVFALHPTLRTLPGPEGLVSLIFPMLAFLGVLAANFALQVTDALHIPNLIHLANVVNGRSMLMVVVGAWWVRSDPQPATPALPSGWRVT